MVDGTSITDAALERKLAAAVKRDPATKVWLGHVTKQTARADAIRAIVKRAGVVNVEVSASIDTQVPPSVPRTVDATPTVVLTIDAKGVFYVGANVVADAELDKELARIAKLTKKLAVAPDGSTTAGVIQKLVERAKAAGLTEISFLSK